MERKNENGDATDQDENAQMDENAQNPESPEIITLSSDNEDDEFDTNADESSPPDDEMDVDVPEICLPDDEMDLDVSDICLPSTSSGPSKSKKQFDEVTFQVKKEFMEETSKTEVSSKKDSHLDGNKASEYLSEVAKRLKNFQQQSSASSYAAESTSNSTTVTNNESSVSLPNSNDSQDLSEAANIWPEQQPSSSSTAASSADTVVSNSTVTATNHSSLSSQSFSKEVEERLKSGQQQSSAASYAAPPTSDSTTVTEHIESSVSLPNSNDSKDLSEAANIWPEQQPSSWSTAASSADAYVNNAMTAPNHSSVSSQAFPRESRERILRLSLRRCDSNAMEMGAEVWREKARPVQAVPRVLLRNCDQDAMEMGAEVWRHEQIVWAPFGKSHSYWPGITFHDFEINKVNKPKHKFVLWFGSHDYSEVRKDQLFDFRRHFDEKFNPNANNKKKAVLEALKILAEMSYISQNTDLFDWGMHYFPGFQNRDEVLIEFLRPLLERLKAC